LFKFAVELKGLHLFFSSVILMHIWEALLIFLAMWQIFKVILHFKNPCPPWICHRCLV